jgi:Phage tail sheath protein FI
MPGRPGVAVSILELPTPLSDQSDTGTWFAVGTSDRGPTAVPTLIQSIDQFNTVYGARQSYSVLYDAVETFFREGGNRVYIGRVVGATATTGTKTLLDTGAGVSLIVSANGPGAWSANYKVGVVAGQAANSYQIVVADTNNVTLEQSSDLLTQGAAVSWANYSNYVRIALGATALNPVPVAVAALSAGNDQRAGIVDNDWNVALTSFAGNLGPGQVSQPGRTSSVAYSQIKTHVENNNRVGLLDLPDSATAATVKSAAAGVTSRFCAAFAPWVIVPGLTVGTVRAVPPCALIAGMIARNDPSLSTNTPSAGNNGVSNFCTDLSQPDWDDFTRTDLNSNSCNVIRRLFGGIRNYGWRSLVNPLSDPSWINFGNGRLYVDISAELNVIGENYVFSQIDGQNGSTINLFNASLNGAMLNHYNAGDLFGDTADQAFRVDTGPTVNTLTTLANNELHAIVTMKMSPFAEYVVIQIVKRQVTQAL